jgi:hypothetical protein
MRADLPSLTRLVDDVSAAMRAADARPRRRRWPSGWPLTILVLAVAVPSAAALRSVVGDRAADLPPAFRQHPGLPGVPAAGPPVAIAEGAIHGRPYAFAAQRCSYRGAVTIGMGFFLGHDPRYDSGGGAPCSTHPRRQPLLVLSGVRTAGQTWIAALARATVVDVELFLSRAHRRGRGRTVYFDPTRLRLRTRPLDPAAVRQGRLPRGYRLFVVFRARRTEVRRLVARDAAGHVVIDCRGDACGRVAG